MGRDESDEESPGLLVCRPTPLKGVPESARRASPLTAKAGVEGLKKHGKRGMDRGNAIASWTLFSSLTAR